MSEFDRYWLAVRAAICSHCADGDIWGDCHLDQPVQCPVPAFLLSVAELVKQGGIETMQDYEADIGAIVCSKCRQQWGNGRCGMREESYCPLERYCAKVIEAIERVHRRQRIHAQEDWTEDILYR
ncbi:MAG TPA: hypothetical protein VI215_01275 [Bacteroidota bacterium]|jgi:hypothetical protein